MYTGVYMKKKLIPIIATIVLFIDQIIKLIIRKNMNLYNSIKIIKNFFNITYVKNIGAAWSIFSGFQIPQMFKKLRNNNIWHFTWGNTWKSF